jgi:hypothetical protein
MEASAPKPLFAIRTQPKGGVFRLFPASSNKGCLQMIVEQ